MGDRKAVIKNADMSNDMQDDAVHTAAYALDKFPLEKDVAAHLKKEFDRKYSPTWHCVVGKHFGSYRKLPNRPSPQSHSSRFTLALEKTRMGERKAVIKNADMPNDMQDEAVQVAAYAVDHFDMEKDIAAHLKKEFDRKYSPTWHCIVGKNFGSYVTHETQNFIYFYFQDRAFLLFKSG
ncbi:probable dynein light chain [Clonorchis sinensis]|uniref:Dynein light chain n=1 Tax=Clonorchis sinensis TaxID=79923 RepID=G7YRK2_CLOSI|nr:probable dynein light chain [Clonorchis sinensis]